MANKVSIPSIVGLNTENMPLNVIVFLQAVEEALKVVDNNVVYKDKITLDPPSPAITALTAQGQAFSVSGVTVASGEDYAALVGNVQALLQSHIQLSNAFTALVSQLRGT